MKIMKEDERLKTYGTVMGGLVYGAFLFVAFILFLMFLAGLFTSMESDIYLCIGTLICVIVICTHRILKKIDELIIMIKSK